MDNNNSRLTENQQIKMKRRPSTISVESPIMARLEIEKKQNKLIAKMTFINMSDKDVLVDKQKLGGEKLREHIFHLNPWYTSPNITFKPYDLTHINPKLIVIKPQEVIVTHTDLRQYYNFDERKYETLTIAYLSVMDFYNENHKSLNKMDIDGVVKPVKFHLRSNLVKLDYMKDIQI